MADEGFYAALLPVPTQIADVHARFGRLYTQLRSVRSPVATRAAAVVERAYAEFIAALDELAAEMAKVAEKEMVAAFDKTRTRPDSGVGPHLRDNLKAAPVRTSLATGAIGIGDLGKLNPFPYWKAQEFGLSEGFVGRTLTGYFYSPGYAAAFAPSPEMSREHPLFRPSSPGTAPHMTIRNPIQPGRFLESATVKARALWNRRYQQIENRAIRQLERVAAMLGVGAEITALER